ncbi:MAG: hypothetical protein AVO33_00765 [delta proteobacterium ML8_F1]|nr:MAG: hypothetical protein AVO33_00765 [delta proteobacterium ML8_F1]
MIAIDERLKIPEIPLYLGWIRGEVVMAGSENWQRDYSFLRDMDYKNFPAIHGGRKLYRHFKKDPTRYRLSSEGMIRRIQRDKPLHAINRLVDIMNHYSIITGRPVGLYDFKKIRGPVEFTLGKASEVYEGVGRGLLNITDLPVLKDLEGPFGSPTSDSVRTATTMETGTFLSVVFCPMDPIGEEDLEALKRMIEAEVSVSQLTFGIVTS